MSRRLLMVAGGGGSVTVSVDPVTLTTAPNGGWTIMPYPSAIYDPVADETFFGWVDGSSGAIEIAAYDHATRTVSTPVQLDDLGAPDTHDAPAILVLASGSVLTAYCRHDGTTLYTRLSSSAHDVSSFATRIDHDSQLGGADYTYPCLAQLGDGTILLLWRDLTGGPDTGRISMSESTDDGATFSARDVAVWNGSGAIPYWQLHLDGDRLHMLTTDDHPYSVDAAVYHAYWEGGAWYTSGGTLISAAHPFDITAEMTLAHSNASGSAFAFGVAVDDTAAPVGLVVVKSATDQTYRYVRYSGGSWTATTIATAGALGTGDLYTGAALDHTDPSVVWVTRKIAGVWQVWRYTTPDHGSTWAGAQVTSGATDFLFLRPVIDRKADLRALVDTGTFSGPTSFNFGVVGLRR